MIALIIFIRLLFFGCALQLLRQNPLVGAWERQANFIRATKIFTPTHWAILIDSINSHAFVPSSHADIYTLTNTKYIEQFNVAYWDKISERNFIDYNYRVVEINFI